MASPAVYTALLVPTLKLNAAYVLGLACLGIAMGGSLKRRIPLLGRMNIPTPIAGGMIYAVLALVLHDRVVNVEADPVLRDLSMIAFMTTVGLNARLQLIREGGFGVIALLAIATVGAGVQNAIGMGLAALLHIDPRLGILTGSIALAGGPATALAFGPVFEKLGVAGATAAGFAASTFGIAVAGLIAGYVGGRIIRKNGLKPSSGASGGVHSPQKGWTNIPSMNTVLVMGISMGLGGLLSDAIQRHGIILPSYIGSMIVAAVIRNLDDRFRFVRISQTEVLAVGQIALYLFIVMALLTLRLWELVHLALPLLVILAVQVAVCWLMSLGTFRLMGRDYDGAVTSAGFCGFMLGVTSNAVASMEELVEQFGAAPRAFLVVPIVGAFLIDLTNSALITWMANLRK